jgi:hypothetical protein
MNNMPTRFLKINSQNMRIYYKNHKGGIQLSEKVEKKFTVKAFQWVMEKHKDQDYPTRKLVEVGKDLSWQNAKKMQKENVGSWIV